MNLKERLNEDMKTAMRARSSGTERLSVIRLARAAIKNIEIDKRHELNDEEVLDVLAREVKQRRDALAEFGEKGGPEYSAKLESEIAILLEYLPQQLSEADLRTIIQEAIAVTGAASAKEMGKVMGQLMPRVKGRADGKLVNQLVREMLP